MPDLNHYIENVRVPLLIFHGKEDDLIDYNDSLVLYAKNEKNDKKEVKIIDSMDHQNIYDYLDSHIIPSILNFISKYCPLKK